MIRICILVGDGVEELDFIGVYEVLNDVRKISNYYPDVRIVAFREGDKIVCGNGLTIVPHEVLSDFSKCNVLVVPGGRGFVMRALNDDELLNAIREYYERGGFVASVCTGSLILAKAGILRGKKATTFHRALNVLRELGAIPVKERVIVSERVVTAAGVTASIDLGLKLVEILYGEEVSRKVAEYIEYPT